MVAVTDSECSQALSRLIGLPIRSVGRACNLLWLHFGQMRKTHTWRGATKTVGEWAIHVQDKWSLSKLGKPITSSSDYYINPEGEELGDKWDMPGARFDAIAASLCASFESTSPVVVSVNCGSDGAFSLTFNDGMVLSVHSSQTGGEESWRLFQPATDNAHFVVSR